MKAKEMRVMTNVYKSYVIIEDERDLKKEKLSLSDYHVLGDMIKELSEKYECKTFVKAVADWLERKGCTVNTDSGANFVITL